MKETLAVCCGVPDVPVVDFVRLLPNARAYLKKPPAVPLAQRPGAPVRSDADTDAPATN